MGHPYRMAASLDISPRWRRGVQLLRPTLWHALPPEGFDTAPEDLEGTAVCRNRVAGEKAGDDLPQPSPLFRDGLVPTAPQLLVDVLELRLHMVALGLPTWNHAKGRLAARIVFPLLPAYPRP